MIVRPAAMEDTKAKKHSPTAFLVYRGATKMNPARGAALSVQMVNFKKIQGNRVAQCAQSGLGLLHLLIHQLRHAFLASRGNFKTTPDRPYAFHARRDGSQTRHSLMPAWTVPQVNTQ
jgi:hypothetical protein